MLKGNRVYHGRGGSHGMSILALCVAGLLLITLFWQVQNSKRTQMEIKQKYEAEINDYQETKNNLLWKFTEKQDEAQRCSELMKSKNQEMNELETKIRQQEQDKSDAESENKKLMESIQTYQTTIQSNEEKIQGMEAALKQESTSKQEVQSQLISVKEELNSLKNQVDLLKQQNTLLTSQVDKYQQEIERLKQQNIKNNNNIYKVAAKGNSNETDTQDKEVHKTYADQLSEQIIGADDYLSKADISDVLQGQNTMDITAKTPDSQILREPKPKEKTVEITVQKQQNLDQNNNDNNNNQNQIQNEKNPDQITNQQNLEQNKNPDQAAFERVQQFQDLADNQKQQQLQLNNNQLQDENILGNNPDQISQNSEIQQNSDLNIQKSKKVVYEDDDDDSNLKTLNSEGDKKEVGIKKYEFKKEGDVEGEGVRSFEQGGRNSYEKDDNETGDFQDDDPAVQAIQGAQDDSNIGYIRRDSSRTGGGQLRGTSSVKYSHQSEKEDTSSITHNQENQQTTQDAIAKDSDENFEHGDEQQHTLLDNQTLQLMKQQQAEEDDDFTDFA